MATKDEMSVAEKVARQAGRLQAEILCIENFLTTITKRDDVPAGIKSGAEFYLTAINELRKADDLP